MACMLRSREGIKVVGSHMICPGDPEVIDGRMYAHSRRGIVNLGDAIIPPI